MFYNRDREQRLLWRKLKVRGVLILAPRRVGKTRLMRRMGKDSEGQGYRAIFLDVQDARDELQFMEVLREAILKQASLTHGKRLGIGKTAKYIKGLHDRVRKIAGMVELEGVQPQWQRIGDELINALCATDSVHWLIQVDELALFVVKALLGGNGSEPTEEQRERAVTFLSWLRKYQIPSNFPKLRWMIASSVGLDTIARRLNASGAINELELFHLGPFSEEHAEAFVEQLAGDAEVAIDEETVAYAVEKIGWPLPYYLERLISAALDHADGAERLTSDDVDAAFETLLSSGNRTYFDTWRQRLDDELGPAERDAALRILALSAKDPDGVSEASLSTALANPIADVERRGELLQQLLSVLEIDGYLILEGERWRFRFELLRRYWNSRIAP